MFSFLSMAGNYESRKVDRFQDGNLIVDTAHVDDGKQPYETAILHPEYNDGNWVIVEAYDDEKSAKSGHDKWVAKMTSGSLPVSLRDCCNAFMSSLLDMVGGDTVFPRTIS